MARILAISSFVAHGHVGLSAMLPVLNALGHEVMAVPTVVVSSHYGYDDVSGHDIEPDAFNKILGSLRTNGWFEDLDGIVTGFISSAQQADILAGTFERIFDDHPDVTYLCDPVLGDDPDGLFIKPDLAANIRDGLVTYADIVTPNRFELAWLTGEAVSDSEEADQASEALDVETVIVTSVPVAPNQLASMLSGEETAAQVVTPKHEGVPRGTGDLFAGLFIGHLMNDCDDVEALARAAGGTDLVIQASLGAEELRLIPNLERAINAEPLAFEDLL